MYKRLYLSLVEEVVGNEGIVYDLGNVFVAECEDGFWKCDKTVELKGALEDDIIWNPCTVSEIARVQKQCADETIVIEDDERDEIARQFNWNSTEWKMIASDMKDGRLESMAGAFDTPQVRPEQDNNNDLYAGLHKGFKLVG